MRSSRGKTGRNHVNGLASPTWFPQGQPRTPKPKLRTPGPTGPPGARHAQGSDCALTHSCFPSGPRRGHCPSAGTALRRFHRWPLDPRHETLSSLWEVTLTLAQSSWILLVPFQLLSSPPSGASRADLINGPSLSVCHRHLPPGHWCAAELARAEEAGVGLSADRACSSLPTSWPFPEWKIPSSYFSEDEQAGCHGDENT